MFENIGGKMRGLAKFTAIAGIVVSVICGIILCSVSFWTGLGVAAIGSVSFWIGSFTLYGFGELIELVRELNDRVAKIQQAQSEKNESISTEEADKGPVSKNQTGSSIVW